MRLTKLMLVCAALLIAVPALSQTKVYTLDEAIQTALENNRSAKSAVLEIKKAQAQVDEAFGYALPSLDLSGNFSHFLEKPQMPFPDFEALLGNSTYSILFEEGIIPEDQNKYRPLETKLQAFALSNNYEMSAQLSQILFNSAVFRGIGASEIYLNTTHEMLKSEVAGTVLNVKNAFYGIILTKDMLEITKASLENLEKNVKSVNALYEGGLASEFDALQAEVQLENFRPQIKMIENQLDEAKDGLKLLLGLDPNTNIDVEGELDYTAGQLGAENELMQKAVEQNFDISLLEHKIEVDDAFIDVERSAYWPNIAAFASYTRAGQSDDFDFLSYNQSIVGVQLQINVFDGFRKDNKVQQRKIEKEQTKYQLASAIDFTKNRVKQTLKEINRIMGDIGAQERNVELAERAFDIAGVRFREGTGTQLEVMNAEIQLRQARMNRLQSVYQYKSAVYQLENLLGDLNPEYYRPLLKKAKEEIK